MKLSRNFVRALLFPIAALVAIATFAYADDAANTADGKAVSETTHDVSKNPFTGNTTETTKTESRMKVGSTSRKSKHVRKKKFNRHGQKIKDETENTSDSSR